MKELLYKVDSDCISLLKETRYIIAYLSDIAINIESIMCNNVPEDINQCKDEITQDFAHLKDIIHDYDLDMAKLNDDIGLLLDKFYGTTLDDYYGPEYCGDD